MTSGEKPAGAGAFEAVSLQIVDGPGKGRRYILQDGRNAIGRSSEAHVVLEDTAVSRLHAAITVGETIEVEDLGSAQGTVLNGRLLVGSDFLFDNDEIRIGPYTLRVQEQRRESRFGIAVASILLIAAALVALAALLFPPSALVPKAKSEAARSDEAAKTRALAKDWTSLVLPDRATLEEELLPIDAGSAQRQFLLGTHLYKDRLADLSNPYRAQQHYKRALAIADLLPPEERPAVTGRSLERILALRDMIRGMCEDRVFAFRRAYELKWWKECYRVLGEIQTIAPVHTGRYGRWARQQQENLDRMLLK